MSVTSDFTSRSAPVYLAYRPDIDGLRAIAVLSVVGYHAFPDLLKGGFTGVDIFFVISGFLIGLVILGRLTDNTFSFSEFYSRRIRRIFPALCIVLVTTFAFGWHTLIADEFEQLGMHIAGGSLFASNLVLWSESGYFDNASETKLLLHLWSLGIEEQFYILWPLLLWGAAKAKLNLFRFTLFLGAISFAANVYLVKIDVVADFYAPYTRFWELLVGSLLACVTLAGKQRTGSTLMKTGGSGEAITLWRANVKIFFSVMGLFLITFSALFIAKADQFPGWWAALPVTGTFLVIAAGQDAWLNRLVLSNRLLVWFGLISFPLYLWHWPLLTFARVVQGGVPPVEVRAAVVLLSILLAWATYKFIESPIRFGKGVKHKTAALLVAMGFIGAIGYNSKALEGYKFRDVAKMSAGISEARTDWKYESPSFQNGKIENLNKLLGRSEQSVLFIGDSLMGQYFPRAEYLYSQQQRPFYTTVFASRNHCSPLPDLDIVSSPGRVKCNEYWDAVIMLAQSAVYSKVVFGGGWGELTARNSEALVKVIAALKSRGKEVILIGQPTRSPIFDPTNLATTLRKNYLFGGEGGLTDVDVDQSSIENLVLRASLNDIAHRTGARIVDPYDYLCPQRKCPALIDSSPLYIDAFHIRASYARQVATFVDDIVLLGPSER